MRKQMISDDAYRYEPELDEAVRIYRDALGFLPTPFQQDLITQTVVDIPRWREAVRFWAGNDYRPQSVLKCLDYYESLALPSQIGNHHYANRNRPSNSDIIAEAAQYFADEFEREQRADSCDAETIN